MKLFRKIKSLFGYALLALIVNAGNGERSMALEPIRILAFGDSLTAGYNLAAADAFPAKLGKALREAGHPVKISNAGISGDTTAGGRSRLDWALAENPEIVILELGANDALRGFDPAETERNLDDMLRRLQAKKITVLLAGMKAPRNLGREYADSFDAIYPRLAAKYNVALYPFFLDGVVADPAMNQGDGIHPTAKGVDVIVKRIMPSLLPLLPKGK
jgi:acyl-CoA thioesterase-1